MSDLAKSVFRRVRLSMCGTHPPFIAGPADTLEGTASEERGIAFTIGRESEYVSGLN